MATMGLILGLDAWNWLASGSAHDASYAGQAAGQAAVFTQKVRIASGAVLVLLGVVISIAAARGGGRMR